MCIYSVNITVSTNAHESNTLYRGLPRKVSHLVLYIDRFCRAMHVAQSAVLPSYVVRPSVNLSVTLVICGHIGWVTSNVITRTISVGLR